MKFGSQIDVARHREDETRHLATELLDDNLRFFERPGAVKSAPRLVRPEGTLRDRIRLLPRDDIAVHGEVQREERGVGLETVEDLFVELGVVLATLGLPFGSALRHRHDVSDLIVELGKRAPREVGVLDDEEPLLFEERMEAVKLSIAFGDIAELRLALLFVTNLAVDLVVEDPANRSRVGVGTDHLVLVARGDLEHLLRGIPVLEIRGRVPDALVLDREVKFEIRLLHSDLQLGRELPDELVALAGVVAFREAPLRLREPVPVRSRHVQLALGGVAEVLAEDFLLIGDRSEIQLRKLVVVHVALVLSKHVRDASRLLTYTVLVRACVTAWHLRHTATHSSVLSCAPIHFQSSRKWIEMTPKNTSRGKMVLGGNGARSGFRFEKWA